MRSLRIAVLDEELPYPLTSGKRIRTFNLLSRLAEVHRITIFAHRNADAHETQLAQQKLRTIGIDTTVVPRPVPPKEGVGFYARLAGNLLSSLPYSVATHTSNELIEAVRNHHDSNAVDLWHCEWTPYAQVLRKALKSRIRNTTWVTVAHNVESMIWKRYTETETNRVKRWYLRKQWKKFEQFERWAFANATWTVAVSDEDANMIRDTLNGTEMTEVVENGVDTSYFQPQRDVERDPHNLLFLGSLDWRPNQDAVKLLINQIFPEIQAREPRATLSIVGRNPPKWMMQESSELPGIRVHGNVPDVRPYLAQCGMMVVPLRIGGGSRLKILESLATSTPVISTAVGAEGLRLQDQVHLTIAEESEFANAVLDGFRNPDRLSDQAELGRKVVLQEYDWNQLATKMEEVWQVAMTQKTPKSLTQGED